MMRQAPSYCPSCGAGLVSEPIGAPLKCKHCAWHLVTIAEWRSLPAYQQGYLFYMQAAWPTSDLAAEKNHYDQGSDAWREFRRGEAAAVRDAQDGEE